MRAVLLIAAACVAVMLYVTGMTESKRATARMQARSWPGALTYSVAAFVFFAVVLGAPK